MSDFFEIDFLNVESNNSGDAIPLRYQINGNTYIHVVDGGYLGTGDKIVKHINKYYGNPTFIDHVIVTHPDNDHSGGLRTVLEEFEIGTLWMLRPWLYANELIERFPTYNSVEHLIRRLRSIYPNIAALEELAISKNINISEPFQDVKIGAFIVMAPTKSRYLDLIVESDKTPESTKQEQQTASESFMNLVEKAVVKVVNFVKAAWGIETFSSEETSFENEMSIVQYTILCGKSILMTGDAGRSSLKEAADFATSIGLVIPGIDYFQIPHHGSRRNLSTDILDMWLGPKIPSKPEKGKESFYTIISASEKDKEHPKKTVIRAAIHRGAGVAVNSGGDVLAKYNTPSREGWGSAILLEYPDEQEE